MCMCMCGCVCVHVCTCACMRIPWCYGRAQHTLASQRALLCVDDWADLHLCVCVCVHTFGSSQCVSCCHHIRSVGWSTHRVGCACDCEASPSDTVHTHTCADHYSTIHALCIGYMERPRNKPAYPTQLRLCLDVYCAPIAWSASR